MDREKDDLKLEYVRIITKDGQTTKYTTYNTEDKTVLKKAQENFDARMKQILEINTNKTKRIDKIKKDHEQQIREDRINQGLENLE